MGELDSLQKLKNQQKKKKKKEKQKLKNQQIFEQKLFSLVKKLQF